MSEFLTLAEAAEHMRMSQDYVRKQCEAGALPAKKLGNRWRISRTALDVFMTDGIPAKRNRDPKLSARQSKKSA